MTTTFLNTKGVPLYKVNGETYCRMIDVIKLIHHEIYETEDKDIRRVLDRMEMRIAKNDFILKDAVKPTELVKKKQHGRYAVGYYDNLGEWHFFQNMYKDHAIYTRKPCQAKLYEAYRDASACADFLDEDVSVLDFEENMTEEDRWQRELEMPMPFDWDEGNEESIPVTIKTNDIG